MRPGENPPLRSKTTEIIAVPCIRTGFIDRCLSLVQHTTGASVVHTLDLGAASVLSCYVWRK